MEENYIEKLTPKQQKFIWHFVTCLSIQEACEKSGITAKTFRNWKKNDAFRNYLKEKQSELMEEALDKLKMSITIAVENLIHALNSPDDKTRLSISKDILTFYIKLMEIL
ncbi:MAG TPA: hypothetical protein PLB19_02650, partial [Candidatus Paceibacterota bacterium]|nr:hypothetical protein [Candidatus Paceibacterota bacterium]